MWCKIGHEVVTIVSKFRSNETLELHRVDCQISELFILFHGKQM